MDPITLLATALLLGMASGLTDVGAQAVRDAYGGLKSLLQRSYPAVGVAALEADPQSDEALTAVVSELEVSDAAKDEALLQQAAQLLALAEQKAPQATAEIKLRITKVTGRNIRTGTIEAEGDSARVDVKFSDLEATEDIDIGNIRARGTTKADPKN